MKLVVMPKAAIFLSIIIVSSFFSNSYGSIENDSLHNLQTKKKIESFESGILQIDPDFYKSNNFKRYLIFGSGNDDMIKDNSIYSIESNNGFFSVAVIQEKNIPKLLSKGYNVIEDYRLDFHSEGVDESDGSRIGLITGSTEAQIQYGVNGSGINVAVVDTGVDFSNPDLRDSLARDDKNHPIMLDPDGQGIVLTNATFFAFIDENGIIRNYSKDLPKGFTSSVKVTKDGVFLDISQGGKGTDIPIYNSFFPQAGSSIIFNGTLGDDMKIGEDNRNYIKSQSGVYRLGVIYQGGLSGELARIQVVPVLFVDSNQPGVYDTIIPDMSTSWEDYTRFDLESGQRPEYDFDFTDEKPIVIGSGKEHLLYDSNEDGRPDYSAGTIGARVLDVYGVINKNTTKIDETINAINGTLLPSLDPDGEFFGLMSDFMGHGTSSAASIASKGSESYDIYNNTGQYNIPGIAPGAKIIPVKALWFGDTVYGWLWAAGFDNDKEDWKFSGKPRADVISNSWGVSTFPNFNAAPGMDVLSLIMTVLATPQSLDENYPGVTMISSAGNSGHGYGTIGLPNASPFGISVGATTNNVFVGYGPFKDQPRFGNGTDHYNHVVDFSSRGPGIIGDPKPDLMSIGAHGFTPANVIKTEKDSKKESFTMFGGTSMAAPIVSGSAAVLMEGLHKSSKTYDPFTIKNILMSTATDLKNDPFTQGSGLVNVYDAIRLVNGEEGMFYVTNTATYTNIKKVLDPVIEEFNATSVGFSKFSLPTKPQKTTSWFAGQLEPGQRSLATYTIENPTDSEITVKIKPQVLSMIQKNQMNGTTTPREKDSILNDTDAFIPNYIKLSDVKKHTELEDYFEDEDTIPDNAELMILSVNFPFDSFMNKTAEIYADDMKISSLYLYDWIDMNNDTSVSSNELSLISRAGSWGTVQELRISEPTKKFDGTALVGVYPVPTRYSYWAGDTKLNSTSMNYTLSASYYQKQDWPTVWTNQKEVTVPPKSNSRIQATLVAPSDKETGVFQGFLTFEGQNHTVNSPVSFTLKQPVDKTDSTIVIDGKNSDDILFGNGYVKGAFDMTNRYMAGDWRTYYFEIKDKSINSAAIEMAWESDDTNLSVFVMDPKGRMVQTNMPSGVFGKFLGWASLDWLGGSVFSQGGGFYPVKNKDNTSTVLYVPINQTGTYSLLTHAPLFGGNSTAEPITITARFLNISPEVFPSQSELVDETALKMNLTKSESDMKIINESKKEISENDSTREPSISQPPREISDRVGTEDDSLLLGIGIGIAIGVSIGLSVFVLFRQKQEAI